MPALGERLVEWLAAYGVDTVFGIPGVHTIEMYRTLAGGPLHHVTPRNDQGGARRGGAPGGPGRPRSSSTSRWRWTLEPPRPRP